MLIIASSDFRDLENLIGARIITFFALYVEMWPQGKSETSIKVNTICIFTRDAL